MPSPSFLAEIVINSDELLILLAVVGGITSAVTAGGAVVLRGISRLHTILGRMDNRMDRLERDVNASFMLQRRDRNITQLQITNLEEFLERLGYVPRSFDSLFEDEYRDRESGS